MAIRTDCTIFGKAAAFLELDRGDTLDSIRGAFGQFTKLVCWMPGVGNGCVYGDPETVFRHLDLRRS